MAQNILTWTRLQSMLILMKTLFLSFSLILLAINFSLSQKQLIDTDATSETRALYRNLGKLAKKHTLFAHQHATEYGHGWSGDEDRSDVKSVTGTHPAMIGVDIMGFSGKSQEEIAQNKASLKQNVLDTYHRGGVTTVAWHFANPVSDGGFYWKDSVSLPAVSYIIPGAEAHEAYKAILDDIGDWANSLQAENGELVPLIFRPYHEFDGDWFWWGARHCSREKFIDLWQFTVSYLRDTLDVHNFIYAFTPDNRFDDEASFLERYPGDEWVDMVGMDNYADLGRDRYDIETAAAKLKIVSDYAKKANKLAAFTETGLESIPDTTWWTKTLLATMRKHDMQLSYVLVWRNDINSPTHYYAPFPGHESVPDFIKFRKDEYTLFEEDLDNIYKRKRFLGIF